MNEAANEKRNELIKLTENILSNYGVTDKNRELAENLIDNFVKIIPPEDQMMCNMLMYQGGIGGATSFKLGNIVFNIDSLITGLASSSASILSSSDVICIQELIDNVIAEYINQVPVISLLAVLLAAYEFMKMSEISITEREATVVWAIWTNKDDKKCVSEQDLLTLVNKEREIYERSPINEQELNKSLEKLESLKCIKRSKGKWKIIEKVKVKYK